MRQLVDTEEAAKLLGVTSRTIQKWFAKGKLEGEFKAGKRAGKSGLKLYVYIDDIKKVEVETEVKDIKLHLNVHRGEPGCGIVTQLEDGVPILNADCGMRIAESNPTNNIPISKLDTSNDVNLTAKNGDFVNLNVTSLASVGSSQSRPSGDGDHNKAGGEGVAVIEAPGSGISSVPALSPSREALRAGGLELPDSGANLPATLDSCFRRNDKAERIANLRFALVQAFNEEAAENHRPRAEIIQKFLERYSAGLILSDLKEQVKKVKRSTLYNWLQLYDQGGIDALVPQYRGAEPMPIAEAEKKFLLTKLLDQNKPTIGDSINKCKFLLGDASPSNPTKLRRWVNEFKKTNYDLWVLEREGEKALNDKCVPYAEREWRDLAVGEAVVADGHKLNFQVINPFTGKPCRAMMVMFWDWKSSYPLGWEIMLTESIQCVVAALRNAVITLGKFPKHALLDNGKAFRANIFRKKFRFQETEIPGIFDKLNITPHFAMPYNAQSKPIERFFRTFNDWFERELPSYTGASIPDKPARMNRNEKRAQELHDEWVPTIPESMELIFRWREYYIDQPSRARDGQRPRDIFEAEKGPGVDPFALHFLMMTCKARMVHRNGITFNGWHWYHENLYGLKDYVLMFYSYYDLSQVYIFTMKNEFLCTAKPIEKLKPFATDSEFPEDMAAVQQINATKRKLIHTTKKLADMIESNKNLYIDWNQKFRDRPEVAEAIKKIERKSKPKKLISLSSEEEIERFEVRPDEELLIQFGSFSERYEFLIGKISRSDAEEKWIHQFETGEIAPGEYKTIYGGGENASQIYRYKERQKVCISG